MATKVHPDPAAVEHGVASASRITAPNAVRSARRTARRVAAPSRAPAKAEPIPDEVEVKLEAASRDALAQIAGLGTLGSYRLRRRPVQTLQTTYLDTPTLALARAGVAVRLRRSGRRWEATAKWPGRVSGSLHTRPELTVPLSGEPTPPFRLPEGPLAEALEPYLLGRPLQPVLVTNVERRIVDVLPADGRPRRSPSWRSTPCWCAGPTAHRRRPSTGRSRSSNAPASRRIASPSDARCVAGFIWCPRAPPSSRAASPRCSRPTPSPRRHRRSPPAIRWPARPAPSSPPSSDACARCNPRSGAATTPSRCTRCASRCGASAPRCASASRRCRHRSAMPWPASSVGSATCSVGCATSTCSCSPPTGIDAGSMRRRGHRSTASAASCVASA